MKSLFYTRLIFLKILKNDIFITDNTKIRIFLKFYSKICTIGNKNVKN